MAVFLLVLALLVLILAGVPVAFAIGISSVGYLLLADINVAILGQRLFQGIYSYPFLALPMFVFAGAIMERGGLTDRLMRLANAIVGHIAGGLGAVTILGSALFGTLCGSGVGGTAAVGSIMIPSMTAKGYDRGFSASLTGCCGILSSLIPPSLTMVIMGVVGDLSIAKLLIAGVLPGIVMALCLLGVTLYISRREGYGSDQRASLRELAYAFYYAIPPLLMPVIVLGGIFGGIVTVTEAAVLAVVYSLILGTFLYKKITPRIFLDICWDTIRISIPIQLIVSISALFGWIITTQQVGPNMVSWFTTLTSSGVIFILLVSALLLALGTFMESNALIIILVPILMPVVKSYGIDPIYFSMVFVTCLCIGAVTPPLGVTLMTAANIANIPLSRTFGYLWPLLIGMMLCLALIIAAPSFSTWLPGLLA